VRILASDIALATGGTLHGPDVVCDGADFDSRTIEPGQLFVPIEAERDGHEFIPAALGRGAAAYLTHRSPEEGTAIVVSDTAAALLDLAAWARGRLTDDVIGITGSVGKTSVKDLTATAVGSERRVWASRRSFNNDQGMPVTILTAPDDTEVLVLEMGMRGFGEIERLARIARPKIGVVTAVAEAHTDRVGGLDGVQRAKGELPRSLPAHGTAVLNADDERVLAMAGWTQAAVLTYGMSAQADVRVEHVVLDDLGRPSGRVVTPWGRVEVRLAVPGRHMLLNAAAALSVAGLVGVSMEAAAVALQQAALSPMRMELTTAPSGVVVLNDAYNANPASMAAALRTLASLAARRRVAVVGLMAELEHADDRHRDIARLADELGIELRPVGTELYGVAAWSVEGVVADLGDGDAVLVKASRVAGLERVAERILGG
jgi:UDP-N-acetylmuramoyl-tripeptide--D-alanyl-D-alanine ligase